MVIRPPHTVSHGNTLLLWVMKQHLVILASWVTWKTLGRCRLSTPAN